MAAQPQGQKLVQNRGNNKGDHSSHNNRINKTENMDSHTSGAIVETGCAQQWPQWAGLGPFHQHSTEVAAIF